MTTNEFNSSELSLFLDCKCTPFQIIKVSPKSAPQYVQEWNCTRFQNYFGVQYASHLHFDSVKRFKIVINHCPWILKYSKWGQEHRQNALKYKNELTTGFVADVSIRWIDDDVGFGVFAEQDFESHTYIGEYTGDVRSLSRWRPDSNAYCLQYPTRFFSWKYFIIDAFKMGNETRFINHSSEPNLELSCLVDRGLCHLVFFTNQQIKKSDELTFDYGPDFWRHRKA